MEEKDMSNTQDQTGKVLSASRRRLLKKIAMTTGTVGASFLLPVKWSQPLIDAVVLPAHAATSVNNLPTINNFSIFTIPPIPPEAAEATADLPSWSPSHATAIDYTDALCQVNVDEHTILNYTVTNGGQLEFQSGMGTGHDSLSYINASIINGTSCAGYLGFAFYTNAVGETLAISLTVNGRESNWTSKTIPNLPT